MVTRWEAQIAKQEYEPEITQSASVMIQIHTEKLNSLDSDFKRHHFIMIDLINKDQKIPN